MADRTDNFIYAHASFCCSVKFNRKTNTVQPHTCNKRYDWVIYRSTKEFSWSAMLSAACTLFTFSDIFLNQNRFRVGTSSSPLSFFTLVTVSVSLYVWGLMYIGVRIYVERRLDTALHKSLEVINLQSTDIFLLWFLLVTDFIFCMFCFHYVVLAGLWIDSSCICFG